MIPHMSTPEKVSSITQPPIIAWGVLELYNSTKDITMLTDTYDKLKKYMQWNLISYLLLIPGVILFVMEVVLK